MSGAASAEVAEPWYVSEAADRRIIRWSPVVLLLVSAAAGTADLAQPWSTRLVTAGLAAGALVWVVVAFPPEGQDGRPDGWRVAVFFCGFLAAMAVLMLRDPIYFVFGIAGFFSAAMLRPAAIVFVGVGATSFLMQTILWGGFPEAAVFAWTAYLAVIVIQTAAIGLGLIGARKLGEVSAQRKATVAQLEQTLEENAGLHAQLVRQAHEAGIADERQRLAREIHDTLAQGLSGIITQLGAAEQAIADSAAVRGHVQAAAGLARESLVEARRSVGALTPEPLQERDLPAALVEVAQRCERLHGLAIDVVVTGAVEPLHPEVEVTLLRVAQESLSNVASHARASRARVTLSYLDEVVTVDVRDDGEGFRTAGADAPAQAGEALPAQGFGLTSMRQRIERIAGVFAVESEPGSGTAVSAVVPLVRPQPAGLRRTPGAEAATKGSATAPEPATRA